MIRVSVWYNQLSWSLKHHGVIHLLLLKMMGNSQAMISGSTQLWWRRFLFVALPGYWLAMFIGTHVPIDPNLGIPGKDKSLHFLAYFGLAVLFSLFLRIKPRSTASDQTNLPLTTRWMRAFTSLACYGGFDELTQPLVGRSCDLYDWFSDLSGITVGVLLVSVVMVCFGSKQSVANQIESSTSDA